MPQGGYFTRNALQTALSNLRASNEELRKYVQELKYEVEAQKQALSKSEREKVSIKLCPVKYNRKTSRMTYTEKIYHE